VGEAMDDFGQVMRGNPVRFRQFGNREAFAGIHGQRH
jgi:hypothetical protein